VFIGRQCRRLVRPTSANGDYSGGLKDWTEGQLHLPVY
jgi:hypothetical protein